MHPTQKRPGYYWKTNDPADLCFNESGPEQPTTIRCYNMSSTLRTSPYRDVPVEGLVYLGAGIFGEPRGTTTKWTGSSHAYGVYRNPNGLYKNGIVILETHGGGMVGYAFDMPTAGETWEYLLRTCPPEIVWNLCNQFAQAYRAARYAEEDKYVAAIVEKRIKVHRRRGAARVEIVPRPAGPAEKTGPAVIVETA